MDIEFVKLLEGPQTLELCLEAVKKKGSNLWIVNPEFRTPEVIRTAVESNPSCVLFTNHLEDPKIEEEICLIAVKKNGEVLEYIKNQTYNICLEAIKVCPSSLKFVEHKFRTTELILEAFSRDYSVFKYLKEEDFTIPVCFGILEIDDRYYEWFPEKLKT